MLIEICQSEHATRDSSEDWLQSVDRGGLIHISQTAYRFFYNMEMEVRKHLRHTDEHLSYDVAKNTKTVKEYVLEDVDVQYNWGLRSCQLEEEERDELKLKLIAVKYITIRGFLFTSSFMELYKQQNKKRLQKSKGLRENFNTCTN